MNIGLDISTKVLGYAVSTKNKVVDCGFHDISKIDDLLGKYLEIERFLNEYLEKYPEVETATLEDFLKSFSGMRTSSNTIVKLTKINTLSEWYVYQRFGRENMFHVHPSTARKHVLGKGQFGGKDTKVEVGKLVESKYGVNLKWTKAGNLSKGNDDIADAVVLSKYPFSI